MSTKLLGVRHHPTVMAASLWLRRAVPKENCHRLSREVRCLWCPVILRVSLKFSFQLGTCLVYLGLILGCSYWMPDNAMNQKRWPLVWNCSEVFMVKPRWNSNAISCNAAPTQVLDGSWWYMSKKEARTGDQNMDFHIVCRWFEKTSPHFSRWASMSFPSNFDLIHISIRLTLRVWALGGKTGEEGGVGWMGGGMGGKEVEGVGKVDGDYRYKYIKCCDSTVCVVTALL